MQPNHAVQAVYARVVDRLEDLVASEPSWEKRRKWFQQQHKTPGVTAHGLSTPAVRKLIRGFRLGFRSPGPENRIALATLLYRSASFEQATIADARVELCLPVPLNRPKSPLVAENPRALP